jgi:hypothetical protein
MPISAPSEQLISTVFCVFGKRQPLARFFFDRSLNGARAYIISSAKGAIDGGLPNVQLRYETSRSLQGDKDNVVVAEKPRNFEFAEAV